MKKIVILVLLIMIMSSAAYADTVKVTVNGLVCAFCATGIEKTFNKQPAVDTVKVDLEHRLVTVRTKSPEALDDSTITKLITDAGYTVTGITREK
jgi:copper chaperone CopZ